MPGSFHPRYLALLSEIERRFPVWSWRGGDLSVWPVARTDLYQHMFWHGANITAPKERPLPLRIVGRMAMPLRLLWKSRHDLGSHVMRPTPAHAVFLGDGVSLDRVDGKFRDRFGEPLIAALEARGHDTFLMQSGYLSRLPWLRPTFSASVVESRGFLRALVTRLPLDLPRHDEVLDFLARNDVVAPCMSRAGLERSANLVAATAAEFEQVLKKVRPIVAFIVSYHTRQGPAFLLACRRQGILSVDLQRAPHESAPHAYRWTALPAGANATLPAVFWSWTKADVARIGEWTSKVGVPWHSAIHGGHTQLAPYLDDRNPATRIWDARFASIGEGARYEREILVALQPIQGYRAVWDALCSQIEASPPSWRWWIRRHPAARPDQDAEAARLLALRRPNVNSADALAFPLPVLLRHMSAVLSLASGAAVEASMFGIPTFFLIDAARHAFADMVERGAAVIINPGSVNDAIANIQKVPLQEAHEHQPSMDETLQKLEERAFAYRRACRATPSMQDIRVHAT